jgi:hypothetical protein
MVIHRGPLKYVSRSNPTTSSHCSTIMCNERLVIANEPLSTINYRSKTLKSKSHHEPSTGCLYLHKTKAFTFLPPPPSCPFQLQARYVNCYDILADLCTSIRGKWHSGPLILVMLTLRYIIWQCLDACHPLTILTFWHRSFTFNSNKSQT